MRLNKKQQETLMYQSRLLFKHDNIESAPSRSLVLTIYTTEVFDTEHFKRAVFQKIHRAFYGDLSKPDNFTYSMMIAGDVESSRSGAVGLETLKTAYEPHFHGLMVFSKSDWCRIEADPPRYICLIQSAISDIREVKKPLIDADGVCSWNTIWVRKFEESTKPKHKFSSSFSNYINYIFKADNHAQKHGIDTYVPSVFPHDLYPSRNNASSTETMFKQLCLLEEGFHQKRRKYLN
jgi:hypothetical protein